MPKPSVVVVGADKGGVGKTTVSRTLMSYYKERGVDAIAYDTETPHGVLKRFHPDNSFIVDLTKSDGQVEVFDNLSKHQKILIDIRAGLLSPTLAMLAETGFLKRMRENMLDITVLHIIGSSQASFDEIKTAANAMMGARHILVTNHINESSFIGLSEELRRVSQGEIVIPKLNELAAERVDEAGVPYEFYRDHPEKYGFTLPGYVDSWLERCYQQYDGQQLAAVV